MRSFAALLTAVLVALSTPTSAATTTADLLSTDSVLRWMNGYRTKPDPAGVPDVVKALSRLGAFKDPESSGAYVGFVAGIIGTNPTRADELIAKMFPLPTSDHWVLVRAIAYSGHPDWKDLLRRHAGRMPSRQVMIEKFLAGVLPTIWQPSRYASPTTWETVRRYTIDRIGTPPVKNVLVEPSPELLDTFWGFYFATGNYRPVSRIIAMLAWAKDHDSVERLTLGSMAKYTLASNAARDTALLAMLKHARAEERHKVVAPALKAVIEAAETVEVARLRKEALAAIEELRRKGPGYRRNVSMWGQVGQGALALGCIAAAATGQVELGLPCIIAGGVSSAALSYWEKQQ